MNEKSLIEYVKHCNEDNVPYKKEIRVGDGGIKCKDWDIIEPEKIRKLTISSIRRGYFRKHKWDVYTNSPKNYELLDHHIGLIEHTLTLPNCTKLTLLDKAVVKQRAFDNHPMNMYNHIEELNLPKCKTIVCSVKSRGEIRSINAKSCISIECSGNRVEFINAPNLKSITCTNSNSSINIKDLKKLRTVDVSKIIVDSLLLTKCKLFSCDKLFTQELDLPKCKSIISNLEHVKKLNLPICKIFDVEKVGVEFLELPKCKSVSVRGENLKEAILPIATKVRLVAPSLESLDAPVCHKCELVSVNTPNKPTLIIPSDSEKAFNTERFNIVETEAVGVTTMMKKIQLMKRKSENRFNKKMRNPEYAKKIFETMSNYEYGL